ncbi:MAG: patatin-like phospholipase family protein [Clostridium sp.]|nr:patatin-like phospholipase family protein [Clostridium sp.]
MVKSVTLGRERITLDLSKEYGLVLEGGGARGAFQIGAWRALREAGIRIRGVSGVSVGALNGALICMDDLEKAENIWENMDPSAVLSMNVSPENFQEAAAEMKKIIKDRGLDIAPLRKLIHETVDEEKIRSSACELYATTVSITDLRLLKKDVKTMPPGEIEDILMASAYLPGFRTEKLGGKLYADGGTLDNVPIQVLLDQGYQDIIVIRIYGVGLDRIRWTKIPDGTNVFYIAPREDLGGMLEFDRKRSRKNMALGYLEACRLLYGLKGCRYYIDAPHGEPYYFDRMMSELELLKLYLKEVLDEETMACLNGYRFFTEHIFPELARKWGFPENWDYKDIYLGLLEELAMRFQLSRYRVYTADELAGAIHRAILRTDGILPVVTGPAMSKECF